MCVIGFVAVAKPDITEIEDAGKRYINGEGDEDEKLVGAVLDLTKNTLIEVFF